MTSDTFPGWLEEFIAEQEQDSEKIIDFHGGQGVTTADLQRIITDDVFKNEWNELKTTLLSIVEAGNDPLAYLSYHIQETRMLRTLPTPSRVLLTEHRSSNKKVPQ